MMKQVVWVQRPRGKYSKRRNKNVTQEKLLEAGIQAALEKGIYGFSSLDIGACLEVEKDADIIWYYYKSIGHFRIVVRDEAIRRKNPRLIVQIATLNPPMLGDMNLPPSLVLQSLERLKQYIQVNEV